MTENKRFHFDYVCGDIGLIDEQAEIKWFIENCCSIQDLEDNWKTVCDKLNEVNEENVKLNKKNEEMQKELDEIRKEVFNRTMKKVKKGGCEDEDG